jgi:hypothetical protein
VLLGLSALGFAYRLLTLSSWRIRFNLLSLNYGSSATSPFLRSIVASLGSSDWFVLYQISKNINTSLFLALVTDLEARLGPKKEVRNCREKGTAV